MVPVALTLLLAAGVAMQMMMPQGEMPASTTAARAPDRRLPDIARQGAALPDDRLSLFSPLRVTTGSVGADGTPIPAGPLEGAFVLGAMRIGRNGAVLLRDGEGRVLRLAPGATYKGWRLASIDDNEARFHKGAATVRVPFGASAPAPSGQEEESSETAE